VIEHPVRGATVSVAFASAVLLTASVAQAQAQVEQPTYEAAPPPPTPTPGAPGPADPNAALREAADALKDAAGALSKSAQATSEAAKKLKNEKASPQLFTQLPWTGAAVEVKEDETRGLLQFSQAWGAVTLTVQGSAPLDKTTRQAALTDARDIPPAFGLGASLEYSFIRKDLIDLARSYEVSADQKVCDKFLKGRRGVPCAGPEYDKFKEEHAKPANVIAQPRYFNASVGGEVRVAHDRLEVYTTDLAAEASDMGTTDLRVNALGRWFPSHSWALTLRAGGNWRDEVKVDKARRCKRLPSTSQDIFGEACSEVLSLRSDPEPALTGFGRVALTYIAPVDLGSAAPGGDLNLGLEELGGDARLVGSVSGFVTPVSSPVVLRFGLGMQYTRALTDAKDQSYAAGKEWWTPFLLVGASI